MAADFHSKHGIVRHRPEELYMSFTDMRTIVSMLPEDKRAGVTADYDSVSANVQGFPIGVRVASREPYSNIRLEDNGSPFHFDISLHFDDTGVPGETEFYIDVNAELNLLMKKMLGGKLQEALDKLVDSIAG